jgi:hypothetical protein
MVIHLWRRLSMTRWMRPFTEWRVHRKWIAQGRPIPAPPIVKQHIVKRHLRAAGLSTVVETGTFTGEMVDALLPVARRIISIELDDRLHAAARRRFSGQRSVELLHGDSATLLPGVVRSLEGPALFWLDGHYTGAGSARSHVDSPILAEVATLLAHPMPGRVVLIDDAREFTGHNGYPTLEALRAMIHNGQPAAHVVVADDIITWT